MTDYVPENSDQHNPPEDLQTEPLECDHCDAEFDDPAEYRAHEDACAGPSEDGGE